MNDFVFDDNPIFTERAPEGWQAVFVERIGNRRFNAILKRMHLENKSKFKMRDLAKIIISAADVLREDIVEILEGIRPSLVSQELMDKILKYDSPESLPSDLFDEVYRALSQPFDDVVAR